METRFVISMSVDVRRPDFSDLAENLDSVEDLGVSCVELPAWKMDLVAGGRVIEAHKRRVASILAGRSLRYAVHGPLGINLMDEKRRMPLHEEVLKASLEVAASLGGVHYVLHIGSIRSKAMPSIEDAYAQQREALSKAGEVAKELGMIIVVENVFSTECSHSALPSRLADEIAAVAHPNVRACIDFSHAFLNCTLLGADLLTEVGALAAQACHLHIHDSFGLPYAFHPFVPAEDLAMGQGDLHLPPGWGSIPWDDLMAACTFEDGVVFNIEVSKRYLGDAMSIIEETRRLADLATKSRGSDTNRTPISR